MLSRVFLTVMRPLTGNWLHPPPGHLTSNAFHSTFNLGCIPASGGSELVKEPQTSSGSSFKPTTSNLTFDRAVQNPGCMEEENGTNLRGSIFTIVNHMFKSCYNFLLKCIFKRYSL